jgi:protein gp37
MKNSGIEWTHHTFNPWIGCTKVSPACDNCYAEKSMPAKFQKITWGAGQERKRTSDANWREPLRWNADCAKRGVRERVFCASLADVFDNEVQTLWRQPLMSLVVDTPNLDHLFLTKRIGNATRMLTDASLHDGRLLNANDEYQPPKNLFIGATICNQEEADRDIPKLLATPAAKRFLSIEPMLGPIRLNLDADRFHCPECRHSWNGIDETVCPRNECPLCGHESIVDHGRQVGIDWVICGGESGPNARPMHPDWARSLRDQCQAAGVPFFFKQWGEWQPEYGMTTAQREKELGLHESVYVKLDGTTHWINEGDTTPYDASDAQMVKVGKKAAGRLLDRREWNQVPA